MWHICHSRVRTLLKVLSSCNSGGKESLDHDFDDLYTCANLLYHHGVRLASVHMIEESTITKLRNVDLLAGLGAIPSEFKALEVSSATTSCSSVLHFSSVLADVVFTELAILIFLPSICLLGKPRVQLSRLVPASIDLSHAR